MLPLLKRHTIQVLVAAGHTYVDVARFADVHERTVRRVQMIQQSYGKDMPADRREILNFINGQRSGRTVSVEAKTQPQRRAVAFWPKKPMRYGASPTVASWNQPQRDSLGTRLSSGCVNGPVAAGYGGVSAVPTSSSHLRSANVASKHQGSA
jgi:hypothetical protein